MHVIEALADRDVERLNRIRLSEYEHNAVVWPELPASAPEVNFPVDFAWSNIETRHVAAAHRLLTQSRWRELRFEGAECRGPTESFDTFDVFTDCWVILETSRGGRLVEAQLFKDVLVRGGGLKIFRLYDDEPRRYLGDEAG